MVGKRCVTKKILAHDDNMQVLQMKTSRTQGAKMRKPFNTGDHFGDQAGHRKIWGSLERLAHNHHEW